MFSRIFTFIMAMFMVGIPWLTSSTHYGYIRVYQQWFDGPWAITAWIIWAAWMVYPLTFQLRYNWHYRQEAKRFQRRLKEMRENAAQ